MIENLIVFIIVILAMALVFKRIFKVFRRKDVSCGCATGDGCATVCASGEGPGAFGDAKGSIHRGSPM